MYKVLIERTAERDLKRLEKDIFYRIIPVIKKLCGKRIKIFPPLSADGIRDHCLVKRALMVWRQYVRLVFWDVLDAEYFYAEIQFAQDINK